jgi:hypothetical protein
MKPKHPGGRPLEIITLTARKYGMPRRFIYRYGFEKFMRLSEDARKVVINDSLRLSRSRRTRKSHNYPSATYGPVGVIRGRVIADWLEEFARSDMGWLDGSPQLGISQIQRKQTHREAARLVPVIGEPDLPVSVRQAARVARLLALAERCA